MKAVQKLFSPSRVLRAVIVILVIVALHQLLLLQQSVAESTSVIYDGPNNIREHDRGQDGYKSNRTDDTKPLKYKKNSEVVQENVQPIKMVPKPKVKVLTPSDIHSYGNVTQCDPILYEGQDEKTPFKIYIYDLPPQYNKDILKCVKQSTAPCSQFENCGMGPLMYEDDVMNVHDTNQFALEVIIHHQLLYSPYRTFDPEKADVFYIPFYAGLGCFCHQSPIKLIMDEFIMYVTALKHFSTKPHIMTIGKIEREVSTPTCPLLKYKELKNVTFIGMEQEFNPQIRSYLNYNAKDMIVVPYPAYGHIKSTEIQNVAKGFTSIHKSVKNRLVYLFLAAGTRRSNLFRAKLLDQFKVTQESYRTFMSKHESIWSIHLATPECRGKHNQYTMDWMQHSVFCLQPPGDSPTRKSFYDSILGGCIPVIFKLDYPVKYPFEDVLPYQEFAFKLSKTDTKKSKETVLEMMKTVPKNWTANAQIAIKQYAHMLQYSYPPSNNQHLDAMKLMLDEIYVRHVK